MVYFSTRKTNEVGNPGTFWWLHSHQIPRLLACSIVLGTHYLSARSVHTPKRMPELQPSHQHSITAEAKQAGQGTLLPAESDPLKQPFWQSHIPLCFPFFGQNLVTRPCLAARKAGRCSLSFFINVKEENEW